MNKEDLENIFKSLEDHFDVVTPNQGHYNRFLNKLNTAGEKYQATYNKSKKQWKPFVAIAASIILMIVLGITFNFEKSDKDLASISPEMAETQDFFTNAITFEMTKLKEAQNKDTKKIIDDATSRLSLLEDEYKQLKINLRESGEDQLVIYAMITNFQNRINILKTTLQYIKNQKTLKKSTYETII